MGVRLFLKLIYRFYVMFFVGEKFRHIKLACLVDCGNYFHERKDLGKAIKYYRRALSIDPDDYYANIGLAGALVVNTSFRESLDFFKKAISRKKADILTLILLFIAYEGLREEDSAKELPKEMLKYFNNNEAAMYDRLSYTYFELRMFSEAERYVNEALKIFPNEASLHYNLAKIYFAEEKFLEARLEFQKTLELVSEKNGKHLRKYAIYYLKNIERRQRKDRRAWKRGQRDQVSNFKKIK